MPTWSPGEALGEKHRLHHNDLDDLYMPINAVADGVADDTVAIQAAIDASDSFGSGHVFLPAGDYLITEPLTIGAGRYIKLSGASSRDADGAAGAATGARIIGTFADYLVTKTADNNGVVTIEDLAFYNPNPAGSGINLVGCEGGGGINRCTVKAGFEGIRAITNCFSFSVSNCAVHGSGQTGSTGIAVGNHGSSVNNDVVGWNYGIGLAGTGAFVLGGRVEVNVWGVAAFNVSATLVAGISFEANDEAIRLSGADGFTVTGIRILGSTNAPSGSSDYGINISGDTKATTISNIIESGAHTNAFIAVTGGTHSNLLFTGTNGSALSLPADKTGIRVIGCDNTDDILRAPVIATGSLPAAGAGENGRVVIEDNGAGDRNLIVYAGGQRFRIDGGANF